MNREDFALLAQRLRPATDFLYFHLMGEPLLHPQLADFLKIAAELGFRVIITTNGTLLPKTASVLENASGLHKLNISLHSFEANKVGDFRAYITGCAQAAKSLSQQGKLVNFRLWNLENGLHQRNDEILALLAETFPQPWQENTKGFRLANKVFLEWGEKFDWPVQSQRDYGEKGFCYGLRDQIGVLCDGTVVPCCLDSDGKMPLGNLKHQSLEEILASPLARSVYEGFSKRQVCSPVCRKCGFKERFDK